jgi:hypothetical protein
MRRLPAALVLFAATLVAAGLGAQEKPPVAKPPPKPGEKPLEVAVPRLTNEERLKQAEKHLTAMREGLRRVLAIQESARREKDIIRLTCVNDKLVPIKGLLRIAEQSAVALQDAINAKNETAAHHEYVKIDLAASKVGQLVIEANACVGETAVYTGPIDVKVILDPDIPPRDPTDIADPQLPVDLLPLIRPAALSPPS